MSDAGDLRYQWQRNGLPIPGETERTYTLLPADVGASITVTVEVSNAAGTTRATSAPTPSVVAGAADVHVPADGRFGVYMPESAYTLAGLAAVETLVGRHLDLLIDYQNWNRGTDPIPTVPAAVLAAIGDRDYMCTIQPSSGPNGASAADCVNWPSLIAGDYDQQIVAFADWVNQVWGATSPTRGSLYVRFAHEMNGTGWYDWQVGGACGVTSGAMYAEGFNHFTSVLKASSGVAKLIFAPNCGPTSNISDFYPSESDILGMDGYNNVVSAEWMTHKEVFSTTYGILAGLDPSKEIWVCETACSEPQKPWTYNGVTYPVTRPPHSKGKWVTDLLTSGEYDRLTTLVWFNIQKERDWIMGSSPDSIEAFYNAFARSRTGAIRR